MSEFERRSFARIACPLRAHLEVGERSQELLARDISKGGVFLFTSYVLAEVGDSVHVRLLLPEEPSELRLPGEVVRIVEAPPDQGGGILGLGIQWAPLDAEQARALDGVLAHLLDGNGGRRRAHPRVSAHLRFACRTDDQLMAVLLDVSRGGLLMEVDRHLSLGDAVSLSIDAPPTPLVSLLGHVRRLEEPERGRLHWRVGLEFDPPPPETQNVIRELLNQLLGLRG